MIAGIGLDIIEIVRLSKVIEKYPDAFLKYVYTEEEQKIAKSRRNSIQFLAGRWAAKEAFVKALGVGIGHHCHWLDIAILNDEKGRPTVRLKGRGLKTTEELSISRINVSISHEISMASAFVVLERD